MNPRNDAVLLAVQGDDDQHVEAWHWRNSRRESDACVLIKREKEAGPRVRAELEFSTDGRLLNNPNPAADKRYHND